MAKTVTRRTMLLAVAAGAAAPFLPARVTANVQLIDESGFVPIGGIDQWIAIGGQDNRNPIILFLHGGPAEAESPFLQEFAPWEHDFTVVNWDQRGSGKTYGKNGPTTPGMTVERMAKDAVEVAEYVLNKLGKQKLILVGHSWGALLGFYAVAQHPGLFHAFVGTGQPVNWTLTLKDRERWARQQATTNHDTASIEVLNATAELPVSDMKRVMASDKWRFSPSDLHYLTVESDFVGSPPFPTKGDVADWLAGADFTNAKLWPTIVSFDARKQFPKIPIPFFVVEGRDDHMVSFAAAQDYVEWVRAPSKAFLPIDGGHFACFTNPTQFLHVLRQSVMPLIDTP
jgi:pimeloyl-ACP methyl ester carboxylesterase